MGARVYNLAAVESTALTVPRHMPETLREAARFALDTVGEAFVHRHVNGIVDAYVADVTLAMDFVPANYQLPTSS
ncbi:MAG TPA: hypothetical protein VLH84_00925 [Patescibacteria group bacterium]|nr:hypothetical protein [Patescibacteria group bacterium]